MWEVVLSPVSLLSVRPERSSFCAFCSIYSALCGFFVGVDLLLRNLHTLTLSIAPLCLH
ncbi:uncharacterized protein PHACADRAFT_258548 [Phanerochaete carnosa HHB-10118-sp]|uniref:Uncharacterized protein n=1 Tax=Phanerochaete carnosa (strain HHB-10118-sp) TaxID=650164 RepID=K5VSU7_PHACS|nr:uncharacterized protein PHACADRAFT_258548 [Phanerochaete carnosa HHB-10118-sp]EKM54588.1 hypothetical protein PHACADRAFT_258548 [Phanerochaete carnosa HHB-10118-sp]